MSEKKTFHCDTVDFPLLGKEQKKKKQYIHYVWQTHAKHWGADTYLNTHLSYCMSYSLNKRLPFRLGSYHF